MLRATTGWRLSGPTEARRAAREVKVVARAGHFVAEHVLILVREAKGRPEASSA